MNLKTFSDLGFKLKDDKIYLAPIKDFIQTWAKDGNNEILMSDLLTMMGVYGNLKMDKLQDDGIVQVRRNLKK